MVVGWLIVVTHFAVMSLRPAGSITSVRIRQTAEAVDGKVSGQDGDTVPGMAPANIVAATLSSANANSSLCSHAQVIPRRPAIAPRRTTPAVAREGLEEPRAGILGTGRSPTGWLRGEKGYSVP